MTYATHRVYASFFAYITAIILFKYNMTEIEYYFVLPIIVTISRYGALFPDLDHNWEYVKEKTFISWVINKLIHITRGEHRSWQTHSIDILLVATISSVVVPNILYAKGQLSIVNKEILSLLLISFCSGWISHMIADMMTSAGVRLLFWKEDLKIRIVPKKIWKFKFNTGDQWEEMVYKVVNIMNISMGITALVVPLLVDDFYTDILFKLFN